MKYPTVRGGGQVQHSWTASVFITALWAANWAQEHWKDATLRVATMGISEYVCVNDLFPKKQNEEAQT